MLFYMSGEFGQGNVLAADLALKVSLFIIFKNLDKNIQQPIYLITRTGDVSTPHRAL